MKNNKKSTNLALEEVSSRGTLMELLYKMFHLESSIQLLGDRSDGRL